MASGANADYGYTSYLSNNAGASNSTNYLTLGYPNRKQENNSSLQQQFTLPTKRNSKYMNGDMPYQPSTKYGSTNDIAYASLDTGNKRDAYSALAYSALAYENGTMNGAGQKFTNSTEKFSSFYNNYLNGQGGNAYAPDYMGNYAPKSSDYYKNSFTTKPHHEIASASASTYSMNPAAEAYNHAHMNSFYNGNVKTPSENYLSQNGQAYASNGYHTMRPESSLVKEAKEVKVVAGKQYDPADAQNFFQSLLTNQKAKEDVTKKNGFSIFTEGQRTPLTNNSSTPIDKGKAKDSNKVKFDDKDNKKEFEKLKSKFNEPNGTRMPSATRQADVQQRRSLFENQGAERSREARSRSRKPEKDGQKSTEAKIVSNVDYRKAYLADKDSSGSSSEKRADTVAIKVNHGPPPPPPLTARSNGSTSRNEFSVSPSLKAKLNENKANGQKENYQNNANKMATDFDKLYHTNYQQNQYHQSPRIRNSTENLNQESRASYSTDYFSNNRVTSEEKMATLYRINRKNRSSLTPGVLAVKRLPHESTEIISSYDSGPSNGLITKTNLPNLSGIDYFYKSRNENRINISNFLKLPKNGDITQFSELESILTSGKIPTKYQTHIISSSNPNDKNFPLPWITKNNRGSKQKTFYQSYSEENDRRKKEGNGFLMLLPGIAIPIDNDILESDEGSNQ